MAESLQQLTDQFAENYTRLSAQFFPARSIHVRIAAYLLNVQHCLPQSSVLKDAAQMVQPMCAKFRANTEQLLPEWTALAATVPEAEKWFFAVAHWHQALTQRFIASPHGIITAVLLQSLISKETQCQETVEKVKVLFDKISIAHPFITGYEDLPICAYHALSNRDPQQMLVQMEQCEKFLRQKLTMTNAVQSLVHLLAATPCPEDSCRRVFALQQDLKKYRMNFSSEYPILSLGLLAGCNGQVSDIAIQTAVTSEQLKKKRGFGFYGIGTKERHFWACMLVAQYLYSEQSAPVSQGLLAAGIGGLVCLHTLG